MNINPIKTNIGTYQQKEVIWLEFQQSPQIIAWVKTNLNAKWSATQRSWYCADKHQYREKLNIPTKTLGKAAIMQIHPINWPQFQRFEDQLKLKAYSPNTQRTYGNEFAQLLQIIKKYPVQNLTPEKIRSYILYCINQLKLSENQIHSRINAIKFYFEQVLHQPKFFIDIPRPKKPSLLPTVLSKQEVKDIIQNTQNLKHKLILMLAYGMGLRVSEIVNLQIPHINSQRMQVLIKGAKGKKDRYANLPQTVLQDLREYYKIYRPKLYLFEGDDASKYSIRSAQQVFKQAMQRCNINRKIGIHGLRHSYATHLLDHGTDVCFIQKLLGHNNIKTTLIYTHVSDRNIQSIQSPLDFD